MEKYEAKQSKREGDYVCLSVCEVKSLCRGLLKHEVLDFFTPSLIWDFTQWFCSNSILL